MVGGEIRELRVVVALEASRYGAAVRLGVEDILVTIPRIDEGARVLGRDCDRDGAYEGPHHNPHGQEYGLAGTRAADPDALNVVYRELTGGVADDAEDRVVLDADRKGVSEFVDSSGKGRDADDLVLGDWLLTRGIEGRYVPLHGVVAAFELWEEDDEEADRDGALALNQHFASRAAERPLG
jgi:hypothetical protein